MDRLSAPDAVRLVSTSRALVGIVDLLAARGGGPLGADVVAEHLWRDDPDGGPLTGHGSVSSLLSQLARRGVLGALEARGWRLHRPGRVGRGGVGTYRLEAT